MKLEMGVTPGEIKTKTPRISQIYQKILGQLLHFGTRSLEFKRIIR